MFVGVGVTVGVGVGVFVGEDVGFTVGVGVLVGAIVAVGITSLVGTVFVLTGRSWEVEADADLTDSC